MDVDGSAGLTQVAHARNEEAVGYGYHLASSWVGAEKGRADGRGHPFVAAETVGLTEADRVEDRKEGVSQAPWHFERDARAHHEAG